MKSPTGELNVLCVECARGPRGMSGHPFLTAMRVGAEMTFKCRGCRASWLRGTKRLAEYSWTPVAAAEA